MLSDYSETSADIGADVEHAPPAMRWSRRALLMAGVAFSAAILVLGALAIALLGTSIALITGLVEGNREAAAVALAEIWRLSPLLLAAEFVLAWLLVALVLIVRRALAKYGMEVP